MTSYSAAAILLRRNAYKFAVVAEARSAMLTRPTRVFSTGTDFDIDSPYIKSYQLQGIGIGSKVEITTNTGHELQTDIPKTMGGGDTAPQPVETLLASWMGCTQATTLFVGRHLKPQRLLIEQLKFDNIQAFRDERGAVQLPIITDVDEAALPPSRLQRITGKIYVMARHSKRDKEYVTISEDALDLLRKQTELRCPVANMMLASGCAIDVEWLDGSRPPLEDK